MSGAELIVAERRRQIEVEGWTAEHDDEHAADELVWAAICYAAPDDVFVAENLDAEPGSVDVRLRDPWPSSWDRKWDKRGRFSRLDSYKNPFGGRIRALTIAGALIAAEIDRLKRAAGERDE